MTTLDVLKAARALISDPARWTQGWYARDAAGNEVNEGIDAVGWCAVGALFHVASGNHILHIRGAAYDALETDLWQTLDQYNDDHTHAEVLALFDTAIQKQESEADA